MAKQGDHRVRRQDKGTRNASLLTSALKIALAVAIIVIVALRLSNYSGSNGVRYQCLLGASRYSLCVFAYVSAVASVAAATILTLLACLTCGMCALHLGQLALSIIGLLWWIAAAVVLTYYSHQADGRGFPRATWRHSIFAMAWAEALIFFITSILHMMARKKHRTTTTTTSAGYVQPQQQISAPAAVYPPAVHSNMPAQDRV